MHNYLELWDALTWKPIAYYGAYKEEGIGDILSSTWHSDGNQFVTVHDGGSIAFWNLDNNSCPYKVQKPYGNTLYVCVCMYVCMYVRTGQLN